MKKAYLILASGILLSYIFSTALLASETNLIESPALNDSTTIINPDTLKDAITIGLLQGGSLIGIDYEIRANEDFGIQIGAGLVGAAAALNYHIDKGFKGAYLSANVKSVGFGYLTTAGVEYVNRYIFDGGWGISLQLGFGYVVGKSQSAINAVPELNKTNALLTYGIGIVF